MTPAPTISEFGKMKAKILKLTKGSIVNLQVAKDKARIPIIATVSDCEAILAVLTKPRRITPPVPQWVKDRYNEAHRLWFTNEYKAASLDGHYTPAVFPQVHKSGGLTTFVINYLTWLGHYGNRINTTGRKIFDKKKNKEVWITGTTKKGTSDTMCCINGKLICFEIKCGADTPRPEQLRQQSKIQASGGQYHFIRSAEMFLNIFDGIVYGG